MEDCFKRDLTIGLHAALEEGVVRHLLPCLKSTGASLRGMGHSWELTPQTNSRVNSAILETFFSPSQAFR